MSEVGNGNIKIQFGQKSLPSWTVALERNCPTTPQGFRNSRPVNQQKLAAYKNRVRKPCWMVKCLHTFFNH